MNHKKLLALMLAGVIGLSLSGCGRDELSAVRKKAKSGDAEAQCALGNAYADGKVVPLNYTNAVKWYRLAADQGNVAGQLNMGRACANGKGVLEDASEAVKWFRLAAEQGNAEAQYNVGCAYVNGLGVQQDDTEAVKWVRLAAEQGNVWAIRKLIGFYRLAAEKGNAEAQCELGLAYASARDYAEALKWYRLSAEQGFARAQGSLGVAYHHGEGVPQNDDEAFKWYRLAAEQGDAVAQYNLGNAYDGGEGVPQDYAKAVTWYRLAAEQGDAASQFSLACAYSLGMGVPQDSIQASAWVYIASAKRYVPAIKYCAEITYKLTPSQDRLARQLSEEYAQRIERNRRKETATKIERAAPAKTPTNVGNSTPKVEADKPRFTDQGDGTVIDNLTKLEWVKDPQALLGNSGAMNWQSSIDFCRGLDFAGHSDWRLPDVDTLAAHTKLRKFFPAVCDGGYWSDTVDDYYTSLAGAVRMDNGGTVLYNKTLDYGYVWPVRGGQSHADGKGVPKDYKEPATQTMATIPAKNPTIVSHTEPKVNTDQPRLTDQGDGTVMDNLTKLEWVKDPHALTGNSKPMSWNKAIDYCRGLDFAGHSDWRLPDVDTLQARAKLTALFLGVRNGDYWSGSPAATYTGGACGVGMNDGRVHSYDKAYNYYVWPVRGGQ